MQVLHILLLVFIIGCAVSVSLTKNLLTALVIFMGQSLAMSVIWILLESPDLAITEAADRRRHHKPAAVRDAEENSTPSTSKRARTRPQTTFRKG